MFVELDGSFVWRGGESGMEYQWDGELIDAGAGLQCVSLKGQGPAAWDALRQLLHTLRLDPAQLLVERVREAAWVPAEQLLASEGS